MTGEPIFIEQHENYHKQTIRNRCTIDSPNGALNLTIPIDKGNFIGGKCAMKDVRISSHLPWQRQHWYALESSYFNSPFFEYLQDDFRPFYEKEWTYLMDFNEALIAKCCELIDIEATQEKTSDFIGENYTCRKASSEEMAQKKHLQSELQVPVSTEELLIEPYYQVFKQKHGFLPDLSIIDLIFNLGPEAILYLIRNGTNLSNHTLL